ncbi:MAG: sulfotransferase [Gammaproteobacteria bacterium]
MYVKRLKRSIPCALNSKQLAMTFRDLARVINHLSIAAEGVAVASARGLVCQGWDALPKWVRLAEVRSDDGDVILKIDIAEDKQSAEIDELFEGLVGELAIYFKYPVKPFPKQVFCIGWPKTGTTSLTEAFRMLGLFSWQFAPWVIGLKNRTGEIALPSIDFTDIADYTAVSDLPVPALFKELDEAFPGSLFILMTRSLKAWSESMAALWDDQVKQYGSVDSALRWAHGTGTLDCKVLEVRYIRHRNEVLEYFEDRKDLLVIDVTRGNPWPALCGFLKIPEPALPFPYLNRTSADSPSAPND